MSQVALCQAVKSRLQSSFGYDDTKIDCMFDGQPPPMCGELFIAVHAGGWSGNDIEGLDETFGVQVTVTRRHGFSPKDRGWAQLYAAATTGLDAVLRRIIVMLHLDKDADAVLNAANTILGISVNGFIEPLRFRDGGRPELKGPDWFGAEGVQDAWQYSGVAQTLTFGGARRVQTIESMA